MLISILNYSIIKFFNRYSGSLKCLKRGHSGYNGPCRGKTVFNFFRIYSQTKRRRSRMDKSIIIDFQYLCGDSKNEFFIKELALCPVNELKVETFEFKPPFPFKKLKNVKAIRCNNYAKYRMGVDWNSGQINYDDIAGILMQFNGLKVYLKGRQKVAIISKLLPDSMIWDLEDLYDDIPALDMLKDFKFFCAKHQGGDLCATKNVLNLLMFVNHKTYSIKSS